MTFFVPGVPIPKGSFRALTFPGRKHPVVICDNNKTRVWTKAIRAAAAVAGCRPIAGPVMLRAVFMVPRPLGHYGAKGLRPSAPADPTKKPDLDKLVRALLDALVDVCFIDDAQVIGANVTKMFADRERGPGVSVQVEAIAPAPGLLESADA